MQRLLRDDGVPPERLEEFRRYLAQVASETMQRIPSFKAFKEYAETRAEAELINLANANYFNRDLEVF